MQQREQPTGLRRLIDGREDCGRHDKPRHDGQWSHLHLQISMLTEQEVTKCMQMLRSICKKMALHELTGDAEMSELAENTALSALANEIEMSREYDNTG